MPKLGLGANTRYFVPLFANQGGGFNPANIATARFYLDAKTLSSLYQTDDTSTPVTADADPVGLWQDLTSNGNDFSQATVANDGEYDEPTESVTFDGLGLYMENAADLISPPCTIYAVVTPLAASAGRIIDRSQAGANGGLTVDYAGGSFRATLIDGVTIVVRASVAASQAKHLVIAQFDGTNGANVKLAVDTTTFTNSAATVNTYTDGLSRPTTLATRADNPTSETPAIRHHALLVDATLTLNTDLATFLAERWGITLS